MIGNSREITVGAIVFAAFVTLIGFVYVSGDDGTQIDNGIRVTASFNRVDGLVESDPVYVSGIRVGVVEKMWLNSNFRAVVTFWLEEGTQVPKDSSAAIHTDGLFGSKYVVLEPGGAEAFLETGDKIQLTQDAVVVTDLLDLIIAEGKSRLARQAQ